MIYNANGNRVPRKGVPPPPISPAPPQRDTGWDTLNWEPSPSVRAPEWGDHSLAGGGGNATDPFVGRFKAIDTNRVQLHWQAKLTPIDVNRVDTASKVDGPSQEFTKRMLKNKTLITH